MSGRIFLNLLFLSAASGAMSSPNSSRASRPMRKRAPVSGASTLSPEQSAKSFALTTCQVCVVICQPLTEAMRPFSIVQSVQEQLSSSVMLSL